MQKRQPKGRDRKVRCRRPGAIAKRVVSLGGAVGVLILFPVQRLANVRVTDLSARVDLLVNTMDTQLMNKSTSLPRILAALTHAARARGLNDTEWATRAGLRKETLSRLRRRPSCDFATLESLADVAGLRLTALDDATTEASSGGHFPTQVDRDFEERLLRLCTSRTLEPARWAALGPRFFMAGLAVMLASDPGYDRRDLLALAESLHPGASEPAVFAQWLKHSPVRPSRFLPMLEMEGKHAT
jgi:hypothetical protein